MPEPRRNPRVIRAPTRSGPMGEAVWRAGPLATPLGPLYLEGTPEGLRRVFWHEGSLPPSPVLPPMARHWLAQLRAYFAGACPAMEGPLDTRPFTPFQRAVYAVVRGIPYGQTWTYGQVAQALGRPNAARAVGHALARNPMPIVIPCHRVVAADGSLHGYSGPGGLQTKAWLLAWERRVCGSPRGNREPFSAPGV